MMDTLLDKYTWHARRAPALLTILPLAFAFIAWVPKAGDVAKPILAAAAGAGVLALILHIVRDAGKRAQDRLMVEWGGLPSVAMLRHRDDRIDPVTKKRYHLTLGRVVPDISMPSSEDEADDPVGADHVYASCSTYLREKTRDGKKFPLVLIENTHYGFRRNLFGLRAYGTWIAIAGTLGCAAKIAYDVHQGQSPSPLALACTFVSLALFLAWVFIITSDWVRQAADDYARRLLASIDQLEHPHKPAKSRSTGASE